MREMKDSGIEWVGAIPQDWQLSKIGSLYTQRNEKVSDKDYQPLSVTMQGILPQLATAAKTDDGDNRKLVRVGDFAINSRSDRRGSCGISPLDGSVSLINIILTPRTAMHPGYYNWLFHTTLFADEFYKWGHGIVADLWTTRWQEMKSITVPVPEYAEQERIAAFLDAECAEIDAVLEKTRASIEEYKKLKQAVITQAVTKGVRGDRPMKDSGIEWIGEIPKEFETLQLKFLCKLITDGTHFSPSTVETGLPYITAGDVHGIGLDYNSAKRISEEDFNLLVNQGCQPLKGDVLLVKDGATTGRVGFVDSDVPCVILSSVAMLRPADNINGHYLMYLLASYFLQNQILVSMAGSAMPRITLTKLVKYIGLLSPLSEQQEIADYLDEKCAGIDALITKKQQYLTEIENYKKSLIYEYVTGKKEVKTSVLAD